MPQEIYIHPLPNGLTLLADRMPHVRSVAFSLMLPAGAAHDPVDKLGVATLTMDLLTRGAGERDNRQLSDALDRLGVDRGESAGVMNVQMSGATISRNLIPTLQIYADILRRPHLPESELEAAKSLSIQDIQSTEDEPQRKVMLELRKRYFPEPYSRDSRGTLDGVEAVTIEDIRQHFQTHFQPNAGILSVAGDFDWPTLKGEIERLFGDWRGTPRQPRAIQEVTPVSGHVQKDLDQTQIAIAMPAVPSNNPDVYNLRGAVAVLSQDMSSRLFSNVREKYGLCYSVYASYESQRDRGTILGYAGARPELAQETLDRTIAEFRQLANGIEPDELDRVKIGLKSALIMRQESTGGRASALSADWYFLGRLRPLDEIQAAINDLSVAKILNYLERHPMTNFTVVTLGPAALNLPT